MGRRVIEDDDAGFVFDDDKKPRKSEKKVSDDRALPIFTWIDGVKIDREGVKNEAELKLSDDFIEFPADNRQKVELQLRDTQQIKEDVTFPADEITHEKIEKNSPVKEKTEKRKRIPYYVRILIKVAVVCISVLLVFSYVLGVSIVGDVGMYPTMHTGDIVLFSRLDKSLQAGDVVYYRYGGNMYFGRIVAVGGDEITLNDDGRITVNGTERSELIYYATTEKNSSVAFPSTVPEGRYFILGDMRTVATDSRVFGTVDGSFIRGKVISLFRRGAL